MSQYALCFLVLVWDDVNFLCFFCFVFGFVFFGFGLGVSDEFFVVVVFLFLVLVWLGCFLVWILTAFVGKTICRSDSL